MSEIKTYSREEYVFLSRLYEKAEKYILMFKSINKYVELDPKLSKEERNILGSGYKNIISDKRSSLRLLSNIEKRNIYQTTYIKEVKENIEKELSKIISEIQKVLDKYLIPNALDTENKVFYLKLKADFLRYKCEISYGKDLDDIISLTEKIYKEATDIANKELNINSSTRLGLALNYSVFFYEIKKMKEEAIILAKTAFDEAKASAEAYKNFKLEDNVVYDKLTKLKLDGNNNIIKTVFDKKDDKNFDIKDIVKEEEFDFDNNEVLKLLAENKVVPEEPALDSEHPEESWSEWSDWNATKKHIEAEKKRDKDVIKPTRKKYVEMGQDLGVKLKALFDAVKKWKDFDFTQQQKDKGYFSDALKGKIQGLDIFTDFIDNVSKGTVDLTKDISTTYDAELTKLHRAMIYELITEVKSENGYKDMFSVDSKATKPDFGDDAEWKKYADYIGDPTSVASYDVGAKTYFKNYFKTNFLNDWIDAVGNPLSNQWKWKAPEKGRILISDTPGRTIHFDAEQLVTDRNFGEVTNSHPIELRRIVNA